MDKKVKSLKDLVEEILYENCCRGKLCKNCKYNTTNLFCDIATIIRIIDKYERGLIYEENNKNQ